MHTQPLQICLDSFTLYFWNKVNKTEKVQSKTARQVCDRENILAMNKCVWEHDIRVLKKESEYSTVAFLMSN